MRASSLLLATLLLAGCVSGPPATLEPAAGAPEAWPALVPSCAPPAAAPPDGGVCVQWLGDPAERNLEASLAVSPVDPDTVLVAWTVREKGAVWSNARVLAGITTDGGRTWRTTVLNDPSVEDLPVAEGYSFDQRALFAPDGTALVLYGGEMQRIATVADGISRITLASSKDGGESWSYSRVAEMPAVTFDYFGFAAAADTGDLYVATVELVSGGVWFWRSLDGGASWEGPKPLYASAVAPHGIHRVPHVAAGADGFVIAVTIAALDTGMGATAAGTAALVSRDGGASFEPERQVAPSRYFDLVAAPVAIEMRDGEPRAHVLVAGEGGIYDVVSLDGGASWEEPTLLARLPAGRAYWAVPALSPEGVMHALVRTDEASAPRWTVTLGETVLATHDRLANGGAAGEDYGGLAFATDGSLWVAFSDPRPGATERIAVAHLVAEDRE